MSEIFTVIKVNPENEAAEAAEGVVEGVSVPFREFGDGMRITEEVRVMSSVEQSILQSLILTSTTSPSLSYHNTHLSASKVTTPTSLFPKKT